MYHDEFPVFLEWRIWRCGVHAARVEFSARDKGGCFRPVDAEHVPMHVVWLAKSVQKLLNEAPK